MQAVVKCLRKKQLALSLFWLHKDNYSDPRSPRRSKDSFPWVFHMYHKTNKYLIPALGVTSKSLLGNPHSWTGAGEMHWKPTANLNSHGEKNDTVSVCLLSANPESPISESWACCGQCMLVTWAGFVRCHNPQALLLPKGFLHTHPGSVVAACSFSRCQGHCCCWNDLEITSTEKVSVNSFLSDETAALASRWPPAVANQSSRSERKSW